VSHELQLPHKTPLSLVQPLRIRSQNRVPYQQRDTSTQSIQTQFRCPPLSQDGKILDGA